MFSNQRRRFVPTRGIVPVLTLQDEQGATAVEYAVMLMAILLAMITSIRYFGEANEQMTNNNSTAVHSAIDGAISQGAGGGGS
ncbi:hypothetical protein Isop_1392 [Isosphaera pallida ATCC 43644]|jgi:Flp pilus assembly pilin Flp|uniref:Flp/Fap pilin component n=1 Tax=Isosphaera pallida (strain ATCC 43644 / DSM 9630 / IS1B) TaxID=575540 RepID=E8QXD6_ISOPI|nr:Flp family type IVb pilin [Isosphaera pallida]ADV61977.1 hypothetical protein Isop_1392 [Isosphaera pallida ATCC 43644]